MPTTKASQKAVHKYVRENYDRINITVPKGKKEEIQIHATVADQSLNGYVSQAVDERMERDEKGVSIIDTLRGDSVQNTDITGRYDLVLPAPKKEELQAHTTEMGEDLGHFVNRAIDHTIKQDKSSLRLKIPKETITGQYTPEKNQ